MSYRTGIIATVVATAATGMLLSGCDQIETGSSNICTVSQEDIISDSKVGQAADERMSDIIQQVRDQLNERRQALAQDIQEFQENADDMGEDERDEKQKELQNRQRAFQQLAQQSNARIRLTQNRVNQRLNEEIQPLIDDAYDDKSCSVVLDSNSVVKGDDDLDLTDDITEALDDEITTINFGLQELPQQDDDNDNGSSEDDDS